jgi:ubiquinone/menaquinone biosynthesis C-methylase UbiE
MKDKIVNRQDWGLNICCGKTDGGGVNADIVNHKKLPNFVIIEDIYNLPFEDNQFETVLCSHTIEHVDDPERFFNELQRVGKDVTLIVPPLWDFTAAFNLLEHKWVFLTGRKEFHELPRYIKLPLASTVQKFIGQKVKA